MVNEGIITLLLFIRLMNWEYDSDPGQRQHIINLGTESDTHKCREKVKTVITSNLSSRKVFEGVQNHVLDLPRKGKFGPLSNCSKRQVWSRFGEKTGPNLPFSKHLPHVTQIIQKGTFGPYFSPNLDQTCLFEQFESGLAF